MLFQPYQTGPHIYDMHGVSSLLSFPFRTDSDKIQNLVWSGAHLVTGDRATFDFKVSQIHGTGHLTMLLLPYKHSDFHPSGAGLILESSLNVSGAIYSQRGSGIENMHEFNVIADGKRALMITHQSYYRQYSNGKGFVGKGPLRSIGNSGFVEVDIETGLVNFEWWALDHIDPTESMQKLPKILKATGTGCR